MCILQIYIIFLHLPKTLLYLYCLLMNCFHVLNSSKHCVALVHFAILHCFSETDHYFAVLTSPHYVLKVSLFNNTFALGVDSWKHDRLLPRIWPLSKITCEWWHSIATFFSYREVYSSKIKRILMTISPIFSLFMFNWTHFHYSITCNS